MVIGGEEPEQQRRYGNKDTIFFFFEVCASAFGNQRSSKQDILGVLYMDMTWLWAY